jgi:hypothetical protein
MLVQPARLLLPPGNAVTANFGNLGIFGNIPFTLCLPGLRAHVVLLR